MALRDVNAVVTITTNAVKAIDDGKKLKQIYADINEQLNLMKSEGKVDTKEFKDMQKLAEDTKAKINEMLRGMELIDKVMGDISGHIGKDLNRALRETAKEFNKTSSASDEGKAKLEKLRDVVSDLKRELSDRKGLTMSLKDAEAQLKNLNNASLDKLKQGLAAVREEASKTTDPMRRREYSRYADQYAAEIAIKEHGGIAAAPVTGSLKSEDRLHAEAMRQRLVQAYQTVSRSEDAGHQAWAANALKEIQQYNSAIDALTEKERKEAQEARNIANEKERQRKVSEIVQKELKGEKVSLDELLESQKYWQDQLKKFTGINITQKDQDEIDRLNNNLRITGEQIKQIRLQLDNIDVHKVAGNLQGSSIDELTAASKKGKEQFSMMKPGAPGYEQMKADLVAIDAELERVTPKWNELATEQQKAAQAADVLSRVFNSQKVTLDELTDTQKTLEAQIKKMEGTNLSFTEEMDLEDARRDLEEIKKVIDEISLSDIDFDTLDDVPVERLEQALKQLEAQEKKLAASDTVAANTIANNKEKINAQLRKVRKNNENVARAQQIASETGKHSVSELRAAYDTLQQRLISLNTGQQKEIRETQLQMKKLKGAIDDVTGAASKQSSVWSTAVRNITAYVGVFGMFNMLKNKLQEILRLNLAFSDQLADIRKVSGLAMSDINQLAKGLAKIDTRTSLEDLSKISYAGAKLGMSQYGIGGLEAFTNAANQLNVALKEDLGDEALTAVAKLTENMGLIKNMGVEKAMLSTSSAIFKLAATSTAAGGPIVEFSKRLAAVAGQAGITTDQLLGMASASDSMMLMPEVASTAFNKMITAMQTNHNLIEKQLGITKGTINELFGQGRMMDAMVLVFEKMKELGNMNALKPIFKDLGSDGARLNMVMTAMAKNVDMLKDHLYVAEESFRQATAVTEEYNIQQETAQAIMERAANMWNKAFMNPEGVDLAKQFAQAWYDITESLTQSTGAIWTIANALKMLFGVLKLFVDLIPAFMSAGAAWGITKLFVKMGETASTAGGMVKALTTAVRGLSLATKMATGFGIFVASLELLVYALGKAKKETEDLTLSQKDLHDALSRGTIEANKATTHLNSYKNILEDVNTTEDDRARILKKFNYEYRGYLNKLGIEVKSVADLATAYKALNEELRKERYYQMQNALIEEKTSPIIRKGADATTRFNTAMGKYGGAAGFDATYIREHQDEGAAAIYKRIIEAQYGSGGKWNEQNGHYTVQVQFQEGGKKYDIEHNADKTLATAISDMIMAFREEADVTKQVTESFKPYVGDYDPTMQQLLGELENEAPDKNAIAEAKRQTQERKKELKQELDLAKRNSDAVISKVEEWYRLQETAITAQFADGILSEQESKRRIRELNLYKNQALEYVRSAITGRDTDSWDEFKENMGAMMMDMGEWSGELLKEVQEVDINAVREAINRFNGSKEVEFISAASVRDAIDKNAAGSRRERARLEAEAKQEVEDMLQKYQHFQQALNTFYDDLNAIGAIGETAEEMAARMQEGGRRDYKQDVMPMVEALGARFRALGTKPFQINPENAQEIADLITQMIQDHLNNPNEPAWTLQFPNILDWQQDAETYKTELKNFYDVLLKMESDYYKARKSQREQQKKDAQERWMSMGWDVQEEESDISFESRQNQRKIMGQGESFGQTYGFADSIANDPEIERIKNRIYWREQELENLKATNASQELIMEKQNEMLQAAADLAEKVSAEVSNRVQKVQELSEPLSSFGEEIGQMLGEQWQGISQEGKLTFGQMAKNMGIEYAKLTLKMATENLMKKLQQALFYKQMEVQAAGHQATMTAIEVAGGSARVAANQATNSTLDTTETAHNSARVAKEGQIATIMAMFGISEGAAKTIAALGWWGIPLIAVISSILMGLLNSAKATAGQESSQVATKKVKLASGMLTYDEGNVQTVVGNDGRVYRAREQRSLPSGVSMVTEPIATTVNGQQALVGERGPEIVIGRKTTRAIQMNRPDLLRDLALIDRGITTRKIRTFDEGNIQDLASAIRPVDASTGSATEGDSNSPEMRQTLDSLSQTVAALSATVLQLQKNGIPAKIQKYGKGGLIDEVQSGLKFESKYK